MAFTSADLTSIEAAILALSTGSRAVQARIGDKTLTYSETDLDKLIKLRGIIQQEISTASGNKRARYAVTGKGY